jgi:hypothetical protein
VNKQCKLCPQGVEENEEHYLLDCPTSLTERAEFARLLLNMQAEFGQELAEIRTASNQSKKLIFWAEQNHIGTPRWQSLSTGYFDHMSPPWLPNAST